MSVEPASPELIKRYSFSLIALMLVLSVSLQLESAPTPQGKTWGGSEGLLDCGNGRFGSSCPTTATITLTWDTPTQREDNSLLPVTEIQGYVITKQRNSGPVEHRTVTRINTVKFEGLPEGVYTFSIATVDSDGFRGDFSTPITQEVVGQ